MLLLNDSNYPWLVLVPRFENISELTDLEFDIQSEILREVNLLAKILQQNFDCHKLNIAAIGNMVRQLHIHVIARNENDASFPKPVWGTIPAKPYEKDQAFELVKKIKSLL